MSNQEVSRCDNEGEAQVETGETFSSQCGLVLTLLLTLFFPLVMSLVACLLWTFLGGSLGGPVPLGGWPRGLNQVQIAGHDGASFLHLPMFLHARGPLVAPELFLPSPHKRPLPAGITALLLPQITPQHSVQGTGTRAVEVLCGQDQISVRVDRFQLSAWMVPSLFSLGSCGVSKVSTRYLYFHYRLTECGGEMQVQSFIIVIKLTHQAPVIFLTLE